VTAAALYRVEYVVPFQFGLALCLEMVEVARALVAFGVVVRHVEQHERMIGEQCKRVTHLFTNHPITSAQATHAAMIASWRGHSQRAECGR